MQVFEDNMFRLNQYTFDDSSDIFTSILNTRKDTADAERFFLQFLPQEKFLQYDFNDPNSVKKFRNDCIVIGENPLMKMGGYNMSPNHLQQDDIRYAGIKMSDPYGNIYGLFDIRNQIVTYSPVFLHFYQDRDLIKFANDEYFTTMTFEDIMTRLIERASSYYVHTGNYQFVRDIAKHGRYILEKVSKDQMLEFVFNPDAGAKIHKKVYKY